MELNIAESDKIWRITNNLLTSYNINLITFKMETFITLATIAGSVLSIILFFKVWSMTNNVKELKKQLVDNNTGRLQVRIALAKKSSNLKDILFDAMFKELSVAYFTSESKTADIINVIKEYKKYYKRAGIEFPSEFDTMDYEKFDAYL
ncbi:MAG: hypothetical protein SNH27_12675 [Rikenellaceae bacterium]